MSACDRNPVPVRVGAQEAAAGLPCEPEMGYFFARGARELGRSIGSASGREL